MVRKEHWRRAKFKAKVSGSIAEDRIEQYGGYMKAAHETIQIILVDKEERSKTEVLEPAGVTVNMIPFYLDAMREFCRISRNFTSTTRTNESINTYCRWKAKGLDGHLLVQLASICDIDIWAYYYAE